jgi:hypothetical protein
MVTVGKTMIKSYLKTLRVVSEIIVCIKFVSVVETKSKENHVR